MSRAEISTALAGIVEGVSGIGKVYTRDRYSNDWTKFLENFKSAAGKITGGMITRKVTAKQQRTIGEVERAHVFVIRLVYGLQDSGDSEAIFQTLVDAVLDAVDADETLGGSCETTHPDWGPMSGAVGLQIDTIEYRQFGTVLCHYAEGRICACETI
jgi:hypothetical protein